MAKTGGAITKLQEKAKRRAVRLKLGTYQGVLARTKSAHHEKAIAYLAHQRAIHGFERDGVVIDQGGRNPAPVFDGTGLPNEVIKAPKTTAERAAEDKRKPLKGEMVEGWKPRPFGKRARSGCFLAR